MDDLKKFTKAGPKRKIQKRSILKEISNMKYNYDPSVIHEPMKKSAKLDTISENNDIDEPVKKLIEISCLSPTSWVAA